MKKFYLLLQIFCCFYFLPVTRGYAQCSSLAATCTGYESRCAATGSIKINATGGSGSYKYRTMGPVNTNYTSTDSITGLSAGLYTVQVNDIITNCTFTVNNVVVNGSYQDPRFMLNKEDVSCDNGNNGSISLAERLFGRAPFVYTIVAPSPMGVGTTNTSGNFQNLSAGTYSIRLTDSCGGIQTRQITINNYNWHLVEYPFTKISCYEATGYIKVEDSRGNISTVSGIPGFMYGILTSPVDTIWSNSPYFTFSLFGTNNFQVIAKDTCGIIKMGSVSVNLDPQLGAVVQVSNRTCSTFSANLTDVRNFFNGQFCLKDSVNTIVECNSTGIFHNIPYGNYCISAYDVCADITINRCFSAQPPAISIASNVLVSNKTCTDFTASITGQTGLTNPQFCLYDSSNVLISCNSNGVFNNLPYGNYCINTRDGCRDTSILKCFTAVRPTPFVPAITPAYVNCRNFGIDAGGDTLSDPQYCLYDSAGVLITCNTTGIFDSIPLGTYCVNMYDSCYDTTIIRCFTVGMPIIQNDIEISISRRSCTTFTARASGASLTAPEFCLYNAADSLLECNTTGVFANLLYGSYCVKARNDCPDTLLTKCFTAGPDIPSVAADVQISSATCTGFTAAITGQYYLTSPQYCIYDSADNLIECNTRGVFQDLPFGRYCIKIRNTCYDTTIVRCFTGTPQPIDISAVADKSCSLGYSRFTVTLTGTTLPVNIKVYKPDGQLFYSGSFSNYIITIDSIPGVPVGEYYKVVAEDQCGSKDSANTGAIAGYFNFSSIVHAKCPGASWANGSADIAMSIATNMGSVTVRIIKKDGIAYSSPLVPNTASGGIYTFTDLGPGTYILRSSESICNRFVYDTVTVRPYEFPNLNRSSAYQCDEGGFSVSAVASNGVAPFTYEIIGSVPSFPSIVAPPQASSIFNVNNGSVYTLIRLRALDACGNATLGDASILPLTSYGIRVTFNCLFYPTTLSVDTIINAEYKWYKKETLSASDSTLVGSTPGLYISSVLPSDTGYYVCYMNVNQGCIKRTYSYHLNGACYIVLPVTLQEFTGRQQDGKHLLYWKTKQEQNLLNFIVERQAGSEPFTEIGTVAARGGNITQQYQFIDPEPKTGNNNYRLKMTDIDGTHKYSNIVSLQKKKAAFGYSIYPNPVTNLLNVRFENASNERYTVSLYSLSNQLIFQQKFNTAIGTKLEIPRQSSIKAGMYLLRIVNNDTREQVTEKVIFL